MPWALMRFLIVFQGRELLPIPRHNKQKKYAFRNIEFLIDRDMWRRRWLKILVWRKNVRQPIFEGMVTENVWEMLHFSRGIS